MPSNFPGGLDSFTTKVDGIDDIMADHVNDLQNSVVAVETLLLAKLTGWVNWPTQPVYVSATSIRFNGINLTTLFPTGTKIRLTQTTVKYFYVLSAAYSGGNTTLTITGGSDYSVANAAITNFGFSHGLANGFPEWINYTSITTYGGGTTDPTSMTVNYARFNVIGKTSWVFIYASLVQGSGNRTQTKFTLPMSYNINLAGIAVVTYQTPKTPARVFGSGGGLLVDHDAMSSDGIIYLSANYQFV